MVYGYFSPPGPPKKGVGIRVKSDTYSTPAGVPYLIVRHTDTNFGLLVKLKQPRQEFGSHFPTLWEEKCASSLYKGARGCAEYTFFARSLTCRDGSEYPSGEWKRWREEG